MGIVVNIDLNELINFHSSHDKVAYFCNSDGVRFGMVEMNSDEVSSFKEKPKLDSFFNIGFMIFEMKSLIIFRRFYFRSEYKLWRVKNK